MKSTEENVAKAYRSRVTKCAIRSKALCDIVLLATCLLILTWEVGLEGCTNSFPDRTNPPPPPTNWRIYWAEVPGFKIDKDGGPSNWTNYYDSFDGYIVHAVQLDDDTVPTGVELDPSTDEKFFETASNFLAKWIDNEVDVDNNAPDDLWNPEDMDADTISFLCGVPAPTGVAANCYGKTAAKGSLGIYNSPAVSFVFPGQLSKYGLTESQNDFLTRYSVMHELGHARGLNVNNDCQPTSSDCAMKDLDPNYQGTPAGSGHIPYCPFHTQILTSCLKAKILPTYKPTDPCAKYP